MKPKDIQQLLQNKEALQQLSQSKDAQALAQLLNQGNSQESLQQIAQNAAKGDTRQLSELIRSITSSPQGTQLLQRLNQAMENK